MLKKERIRVEIKEDHSKARLSFEGYRFEIPLRNWAVNGGLTLTIPWEWVDLVLRHSDSTPLLESEPFFAYWDQPWANSIDPATDQ
jgi:hypothetical protein